MMCEYLYILLITAHFSLLSRGMINQLIYYLHISLLPYLHKSSIIYYLTTTIKSTFYVYGSVHHNIFYEITNRCSYMQSILFHC